MDIYPVLEDSLFFSEFLESYLRKHPVSSFLDMGTGTGVLAKTALKVLPRDNVVAVDINKRAIKALKKEGINAIHSNLFQNVKGSFDIITFNAPYLPLDKREPKSSRVATTGGKRGDEISLKFLNQAIKHLTQKGYILLLISSLTPFEKISKYKPLERARKKLFYEDLIIYKIVK